MYRPINVVRDGPRIPCRHSPARSSKQHAAAAAAAGAGAGAVECIVVPNHSVM